MKKLREIKQERGASSRPFGYSEAVLSKSYRLLPLISLCVMGCASTRAGPDPVAAPGVFYTVTGEIAANRKEPRIAALQYAAAAARTSDVSLLERASQVTQASLQPSLTEAVAARWIEVAPESVEAHRAAAGAALALDSVAQAAEQYRVVVETSPRGADAELADLEVEFGRTDNIFGARQTADRLAAAFPKSQAALRLQGFAAMRADDPKAAVSSFEAALALEAKPPRRRPARGRPARGRSRAASC